MKSIDNYIRNRKQVKADRATEQGIAGHQAAMKALGSAAGWGKLEGHDEISGTDPKSMAGSLLEGLHTPYKKPFESGKGNLDVKVEDY